jgi:4-hydroxy-tetrahydrodipicolinate synthase
MTSRSELINDLTSSTVHYTISEGLSLSLRDITALMVTPLRNRDTLGVLDLERLVEHMLNDGVYGLFILGTTGERTTPLTPTEGL